MYILSDEYLFPPVYEADEYGVVAIGGDLHSGRLIKAYQSGIFPWYNEGEPVVWYAPDHRMVLKPSEVYVSKSMQKILRSNTFTITYNKNFREVITACQTINRPGQDGTWITADLKQAMIKLHLMGIAKSVEIWRDGELVGGLYGVDLGHVFCGESMFARVSNASKIAFILLCRYLEKCNYDLLDCQVYNDHLASLGAYEMPRQEFMNYLAKH